MAADYKTLFGLVKEFVEVQDALNSGGADTSKVNGLMERARGAVQPSVPKPPPNDITIVHRIPEDDPCCGPSLRGAAKRGHLDNGLSFTCGKCGTNWKATRTENVVDWQPESNVMVFKGAK